MSKLYDHHQLHLVNATASIPPAGKVTMTDSFAASIAGFSDWLPYSPGRRKCESTCARYTQTVVRFAGWAREQGRASFAEVTKADLRAYLSGLKGGQAAESTRASYWWALYRYLADEEDLPDLGRSVTMHRPPVPVQVTHLDSRQVGQLLDACRDAREKALIMVFLDSGVRIAEAQALKVTDVCVENLRARRLMVTGKGSKVRAVVIGTETALALRRYLKERARGRHADCEALWLGRRGPLTIGGLDQLIRAIGTRAGLEIHPHLLRHTWAHCYKNEQCCV